MDPCDLRGRRRDPGRPAGSDRARNISAALSRLGRGGAAGAGEGGAGGGGGRRARCQGQGGGARAGPSAAGRPAPGAQGGVGAPDGLSGRPPRGCGSARALGTRRRGAGGPDSGRPRTPRMTLGPETWTGDTGVTDAGAVRGESRAPRREGPPEGSWVGGDPERPRRGRLPAVQTPFKDRYSSQSEKNIPARDRLTTFEFLR